MELEGEDLLQDGRVLQQILPQHHRHRHHPLHARVHHQLHVHPLLPFHRPPQGTSLVLTRVLPPPPPHLLLLLLPLFGKLTQGKSVLTNSVLRILLFDL